MRHLVLAVCLVFGLCLVGSFVGSGPRRAWAEEAPPAPPSPEEACLDNVEAGFQACLDALSVAMLLCIRFAPNPMDCMDYLWEPGVEGCEDARADAEDACRNPDDGGRDWGSYF